MNSTYNLHFTSEKWRCLKDIIMSHVGICLEVTDGVLVINIYQDIIRQAEMWYQCDSEVCIVFVFDNHRSQWNTFEGFPIRRSDFCAMQQSALLLLVTNNS